MGQPYTICRIAGEGVGPVVLEAACRVLESAGVAIQWETLEAGWPAWKRSGATIEPRALEAIRRSGALLLGPFAPRPGLRGYRAPLSEIRPALRLNAGFFPFEAPGRAEEPPRADATAAAAEARRRLYLWWPAGEGHTDGIEFSPPPRSLAWRHPALAGRDRRDTLISIRIASARGLRRLCAAALDHAAAERLGRVTAVHRAALLRRADGEFLRAFREEAARHPGLETREMGAFEAVETLLRAPGRYESLAASGAAFEALWAPAVWLAGGAARAAYAELGEGGGVFQPVHGPGLRFEPKERANPTAMIRAGALLLEWLGESEAARRIERALALAPAFGAPGAPATAAEFAAGIARRLQDPPPATSPDFL